MKATQPTVETYEMFGAGGRYIGPATQVTLPNGQVRAFSTLLPDDEAIRQAIIDLGQHYEVTEEGVFEA